MENTSNASSRNVAVAFHLGAMLLALFLSPFNIILPVVALLFVGKKGSFLNNQVREVARFQIMGIIVVIGAFLITLGLAAVFADTGALIGYYLVKAFAIGYYVMPAFACIQLLRGRNYAYPLVRSPRRKAYVNETRAVKGGKFH